MIRRAVRFLSFTLILLSSVFLLSSCGGTTDEGQEDDEGADDGADDSGDDGSPDDDSSGDDDTDDDGSPDDDDPAGDDSGDFPPCGDQQTFFTVDPLDDASYLSIIPLGNLNPSAHTFPTPHTYMELTDNSVAVPVYAPADITITQILEYPLVYSITFYLCAEVYGYFDHVGALSDEILAQFDASDTCDWTNGDSDMTPYCISIPVEAGAQIGTIGGPGEDGSAALDFGLRDSRIPEIDYANPARASSTQGVVCPYDYYEPGDVKEALFDKLREARTVDPVCGSIDVDVANTAQGRWYLPGSDLEDLAEENHLALVPSNFDPGVSVLSVGNPSVGTGRYYFDPLPGGPGDPIRKAFDEVPFDSNIYCYDNLRNGSDAIFSNPVSGRFFLTMNSTTTLTIERDTSSDTCPADPNTWVFTGAAVQFER